MSTLTIRLPDDKAARLRQLAKHRSLSVNKLMEELATISIAEFDRNTQIDKLEKSEIKQTAYRRYRELFPPVLLAAALAFAAAGAAWAGGLRVAPV